jgi:uncharacterized protein (TIGR00106 family)
MKPIIAEVVVVPLGTASPSLSQYVADIEKVLQKYTGIKTLLTPMSTIIEGDLDLVLGIIREMHEVPFLSGAQRVSTRISIDDRRDKIVTIDNKLKAVTTKL